MKDKIEISFVFNDANYHGAYQEHLKHRQKMWIRVRSALCVLMVLFGGYLLVVQSQSGKSGIFGPLFITAGSVGFLRPMIWQMWHERNVRKHPAYHTTLHYTFDQKGVHVDGKQGRYLLAWGELYECVLRRKGVLVYPEKKKFLWIPRRCFSVDQWNSLDALYCTTKKNVV